MGQVTHTAGFKAVAITVAQDLFEVRASSSSIIVVHGFSLFQTTDLGDAAEEVLRLTTNRGSGSVTSGSGGTTATAALVTRANTAFGGTVEVNNTTVLAVGSGTLTNDMEHIGWNIRIPQNFWWTPEARPIILPSDYWTLELEAAPADSVTVSGTIYLEQIGI
jgi:hypothetical protein